MKRGSLWIFAAVISIVLAVGSPAAQKQADQTSAGLKSLELGNDLSPVMKFDPAFSPTVHYYSVTVDSTNVWSAK